MVASNQSAFVTGRSIHDNFLLVQKTVHQLHNLKVRRVLLKLDIAHAFSSVSCLFLLEILQHLGVGPHWGEWVFILLSTASMRVLLYGTPGSPIRHARGLRQGDPLSPMLFTVVIDALNSLLQHAVHTGRLTIRHTASSILLYANEVVIFCHPNTQDLRSVRELSPSLESPLAYKTTSTNVPPLQYAPPLRLTRSAPSSLALSLASRSHTSACLLVRRPSAAAIQPLADKMANRLPTLPASLLPCDERLAHARHVLGAMSVHLLLVMALCPPILKQNNYIIRDFLWHGCKDVSGVIALSTDKRCVSHSSSVVLASRVYSALT